MPNPEDTSLNISVADFTPIASSSQHCSNLTESHSKNTQSITKELISPIKGTRNDMLQLSTKPSTSLNASIFSKDQNSHSPKFGLWSNYIEKNSNDSDQGITLTQLHDLSTPSLWNLKQWKEVKDEYHHEMLQFTIKSITKDSNQQAEDQFVPFLAAVISRQEAAKNSMGVTLILKDQTGEIKAMIEKNILAENQHLIANSVVVLRNFRILPIKIAFRKGFYIKVNKENIEAIFTSLTNNNHCNNQGNQKETTKIQYFASKEINNLEMCHNIEQNQQENILIHRNIQNPSMNLKRNDVLLENKSKIDKSFVIPNFEVPDLDLDLDFDDDFDSNLNSSASEGVASCKKQKTGENSVSSTDFGVLDAQIKDKINDKTDNNLGLKPKKRFKYVKREHLLDKQSVCDNNLVVDKLQLKVMNESKELPEIITQIKIASQKAGDTQIVEDIFKGLDVSCMLDDF